MRQLPKAFIEQRDNIIKLLQDKHADLDMAIHQVNDLIEDKVAPAITAYNEVLDQFLMLRDDIVVEMESYFDTRSDKWKESETGSSYDTWKDQWESYDPEHLEPLEEIEVPPSEHADDIGNLPDSPED